MGSADGLKNGLRGRPVYLRPKRNTILWARDDGSDFKRVAKDAGFLGNNDGREVAPVPF